MGIRESKGGTLPEKLYQIYRKWSKQEILAQQGVIVGADLSQEWLLPWWWDHYHTFNDFPVTFIDFGLSQEAKKWCVEKGTLLPLRVADIFVVEKEQIPSHFVQKWEDAYGREFWINRNGWFKKPLACLLSPYQQSVWIDLDCEVRGSIAALFTLCAHPSGIAMAQDLYDPLSEEIGFNSGVIVFKQGIQILEDWADQAFEKNHLYAGDQSILSWIIQEQKLSIAELPPIYNWSRRREENREAIIVHWHGKQGKEVIVHQIRRAHLRVN